MQINPEQLLTLEESQAIDQTLLPAQDRFLIRVAIYSWRYLQNLIERQNSSWDELNPTVIKAGLETDADLIAAESQRPGFRDWYAQFLQASLTQLQQAAITSQVHLSELTVSQIIEWFTQQAQTRLSPKPPRP